MNRNTFNEYILDANFRGLFLTELGWNKPKGNARLLPITVEDKEYAFTCMAERSGLQVLVAEVDAIPTNSLSRRIDSHLRNQAQDYIAIYKLAGKPGHHAWVVPVKNVDKRDLVSIEYENPSKADFLLQKLDFITFDHATPTTIVDVKEGVQKAFAVNAEKITKDFYSGFKKEHKTFADFITGIDDHIVTKDNRNKQWYASVMLNRLMFCYFIQKKGFLDGNVNYLREKLDWVRRQQGSNRFFGSFYKEFLKQLFADGLNSPKHDREFVAKFGRIPYLNGGMFDSHRIERDYADIDIGDDAFISLFNFFDKWQWHLDTRVTATGRDINPDVLGYIFEQYINDRAAMGAYYTKEDITEYIGRNCILPFLFDEVKRTTNDEGGYFAPDGYVWQSLRESGDRYIFDAVKKGYRDFKDIPENIRRGIITDEMRHEYSELSVNDLPEDHIPLAKLRKDWNTKTPERWGLPTEIWRETIERLQRCGDILAKIENGEITSINDFITYNLDIRSFAQDLLSKGDNRFVGRFYRALQRVTILDPTCGSGAFLFAAMNILEPLYEICIERMQEFNAKNHLLFKKELDKINHKYRSNIQYFIYKSIILRNLYGVDIMVEATEIAKLRLFLKMVAVVDVDYRAENLGLDPLPDIDFNIRCGNTLVGYANKEELNRDLTIAGDILQMLANEEFKGSIEEEMRKVASTYKIFKTLQLTQEEDMAAFKQAKHELHTRLKKLNDILNHRYFTATQNDCRENSGKNDIFTSALYEDWLKSHQPFHWLAEFYQIIAPVNDGGNGGFDVIIGNPPYVEISVACKTYSLASFKTQVCGNLYACVLERCMSITCNSNLGLIVQLPICCTDRMIEAQNILKSATSWIFTFDDRPGKLFDGLQHIRATIFIMRGGQHITYTSKYNRWYSENRKNLFQNLKSTLSVYTFVGTIPKNQNLISNSILKKILLKKKLDTYLNGEGIVYIHNAPQYFTRITTFKPYFWNERKGESLSVSVKMYAIKDKYQLTICSLLDSNLFYWWYVLMSDCRHLNKREIEQFPFFPVGAEYNEKLLNLCILLMNNFKKHSSRKLSYLKTTGKIEYEEYYPKYSKPIIDEIDRVLAKHYGFTEEELDFIINYDIKYRMGDELNLEE